MTGTVAWFEDEKGFGKIRTDSGELFFHWSEIVGQSGRRSLAMGDRVEFEIGEHRGRSCAVNVRLAPEAVQTRD